MTQILTHSDEVSGITVFDDGTRVYWTEGRSSSVVAKLPITGSIIDITDQSPWNAHLWREERRIEENGADECRAMTPEEEKEWHDARYPDTADKEN